MRDLAGIFDSDDAFSDIDTTSEQHLRETAARAVITRRGTIREFPDRYVDLAGFIELQGSAVAAAGVAAGVQDDLEQDSRINRATVEFGAPDDSDRIPFTISIEPVRGEVVIATGSV